MKNGPAKCEYMRQWRLRNPGYHRKMSKKYYTTHGARYRVYGRKATLKAKYGITVEAYELMLAAQCGCCALCGKPPGRYRLAVDHNHMTGNLRKLLCAGCNTRISALDDPVFKAKAIAYLEAHNG